VTLGFDDAIADLEEVLPGGATFILVDEAWYSDLRRDGAIVPGRRDVPFLERDGEYWGRPADDAIAVAEMYRLRQEGASFIVFTGNCFWWLEHYTRLHDELRSRFDCIFEGERVIVFDLDREKESQAATAPDFLFAADVESAVTAAECRRLASLARGKIVLELGSWLGRSTIAIASTAATVHAVDWHRGDEHAGHGDTLQSFLLNLLRYGVRDKVVVHLGRFEDVGRVLRQQSFDVVVVDGLHTRRAVEADIALFLPILRPGGSFAFHDYCRFEVKEAVDEFALQVGGEVDVTDTLAVVSVAAKEVA